MKTKKNQPVLYKFGTIDLNMLKNGGKCEV